MPCLGASQMRVRRDLTCVFICPPVDTVEGFSVAAEALELEGVSRLLLVRAHHGELLVV